LGQRLDGHRLCGVIETSGQMTDHLTLGYRTANFQTATPLGPGGTVVRGHEFHYSTIDPPGEALVLVGRTGSARGGWASARLLASYLHLHLAGAPHLATAFVQAATRHAATS
jgi:cobyrinic acid a,c-diamide synthase